MKYFSPVVVPVLLLLLGLQSCGSYRIYTGIVQFDASERNNIIKSRELTNYLSERDQIKFVLRTPAGFQGFSEEEQFEWNEVFSQIEKELILQGHIVKDRVLLDLLLDKGDMSLTEVGKALDTDIIIELINIKFDLPNQIKNFRIKEKGINTNFDYWENIESLDCRIAMMECRITLVDVGNVGGIFKFNVSGCDTGSEFYVKLYEQSNGDLDHGREAYVGWNYDNVSYKSLTRSYNMNDMSVNKAIQKLVASLLQELKQSADSGD